MDWKTLLGTKYTEGMTDEDAQTVFNEMYVPKEDFEKKLNESKTLIDKYSAEISERKRKERERMSEEEKAKADREAAIEAEKQKAQEAITWRQKREQADVYESMGYVREEALGLAEALVTGDTQEFNSLLKVANENRTSRSKKAWESEYSINPPAGNGNGKVDYSKQIQEAQARGDNAAAIHYINLQAAQK